MRSKTPPPSGRSDSRSKDRRDSRPPRRDEPRSPRRDDARAPRRHDERPPRREKPASFERTDTPTPGRYVYGVNPVLEALRARPEEFERILVAEGQLGSKAAAEILSRARAARIRVETVLRERLVGLAEGGVHQGVVAEMRAFDYASLDDILAAAEEAQEPALVVLLDGIQDPHNLGAIIRSAHALGAHGVVVPKDRAVAVTGAVAKASAGAIEHTLVARVTNLSRALEELKDAGLWSVAADPEGTDVLWAGKLNGPLALVVGAEGEGVREGVLKHCDFRLKIPMGGEVASLNASVSAALLMYEVVRQRANAKVP